MVGREQWLGIPVNSHHRPAHVVEMLSDALQVHNRLHDAHQQPAGLLLCPARSQAPSGTLNSLHRREETIEIEIELVDRFSLLRGNTCGTGDDNILKNLYKPTQPTYSLRRLIALISAYCA